MSATLHAVPVAGEERFDAEAALARARAAEAAGELDAALSELNRILAIDPDHAPSLRALARLLTDRGETERAAACYERLLAAAPSDVEAALELGALREAEGRVDEAVALYKEVVARSADARLESAARAAALAARRPESAPALLPSAAPATLPAPSDAHAVAFAELFAGREGTYARQWAGEDGRAGYTPVHEPFTPAVARHHLLGSFTVGIYPLRLDLTVRFLCFDVDVTREALRAATSPSERARLVARTQELALRIVSELAALGLVTLLEESGNRGRHVWLLLREPLPSVHLRRLGLAIVARLGELPAGLEVELFPRQSRLERGALGNLVKLPLGVHRATGRRSLFLDAAGEPLPAQLDLLLDPPRVTTEAVASALARLSPGGGDPDEGDPDPDRSAPAPRSPEPATLTRRAEPEAPYRLEDDLEVQRVLSGCAVLGELVRRVAETGVIDAEERIVITHTLGCLSRGAQAVNAVLAHVVDLDPALRLASRLRGSPTSCARIRSRVPALAERAGCDCVFAPGSLYPSPVLHAGDSSRTPTLARHEVDRAVRDYLRLRSERDRVTRAVMELARRLRALMDEQGVESLATGVGTLRAGPGELDLILEV